MLLYISGKENEGGIWTLVYEAGAELTDAGAASKKTCPAAATTYAVDVDVTSS